MATNRNRHTLALNVDRLEGRALLSGYAPAIHAQVAHVQPAAVHTASHHAAPACHHSAKAALTGNLTGTSSFAGTTEGVDTYKLSGTTNLGDATVTGTDTYSSLASDTVSYSDLYYGGNWKMTLNNSQTVQISYVGKGTTPVSGTGAWSQNLTGTAVVTAGPQLGHVYNFSGKLWGTFPGTTTNAKIVLK